MNAVYWYTYVIHSWVYYHHHILADFIIIIIMSIIIIKMIFLTVSNECQPHQRENFYYYLLYTARFSDENGNKVPYVK